MFKTNYSSTRNLMTAIDAAVATRWTLSETTTTPSGILRRTYTSNKGAVCYRYSKAGSQVGSVDWQPEANRKGTLRVRDHKGNVTAQILGVAHVYVLMILGGALTVLRSDWAEVFYAAGGRLVVFARRDRSQILSMANATIRDAFKILGGAVAAKSTGRPSIGATVHAYKLAARKAA